MFADLALARGDGRYARLLRALSGVQLLILDRFGERLFALAREPKRFLRYPAGDHDDLDGFGSDAEVRQFILDAAQ